MGLSSSLVRVVGISLILLAGIPAPAQEKIPPPETVESIRENLARVEQLRNQAEYENGLSLAQASLRQAEELGQDDLITEALFQLSLIHYFLESFEEARVYMEIGLTHARLHGLTNMEGDFLNAQGVLEWKQGNLFEATAKLQEALQIKKEAGQWVSMASISNNLGIIFHSLQKYTEAVENYKRGLEWLGDHNNDHMRASLHSNIGESLIPLGRFEEAEYHLKASMEIELKGSNPLNLAYTYFNMGELRSGEGRSDEAIDLYETALEIQLEVKNTWAASLTRLKLSKEYLATGNVEKAIEVLDSGYEDVMALNTLPLLRDYAEQFSVLYGQSDSPELKQYYSDLHQWFKDRLNSVDIGTRMSDMPEPSQVVDTIPLPPSPDFSFIRVAILALLIVLVLYLLVENIRLRKEMRDK